MKKYNIVGVGLMAVMALLPAFVHAQQYNLKQCLDYAIESNASVDKARYDFQEGEEKTREVKAQALPQVNGTASFTDNLIIPSLVIGDQVIKAGAQYNTNVGAEASQQLFNQSVFTGIRAAKVSEEYYSQNLQRTEEEVIQETASLFYQAVAVQAQRSILESNIRQVEKNLTITQDRFKNGLVRKVEVDRLRVNLTNLKTKLRSLEDSHAKAMNQLKVTMGMDVNVFLTLDEPLLQDTTTYQFSSELLQTDWVWEDKIEYKQLNTQLKLYDLERQNYVAGYYPTLTASAKFSRTGVSSEFSLPADNSNWYSAASVGLNLNIPIFDGFRKSAQTQQSKIRKMKTERDMTYSKQLSNTNYIISLKALETNYDNYLAQKENVALAREVYTITEQNYREGISPLTELIDAENSMLVSENQLIESLLNVKQAEVTLLKSKGEIKNLLN